MKYFTIFFFLLLSISSCSKKDTEAQLTTTESMYFPGNTDDTWDTQSLSSLGWNQNAVQPLNDFLIQQNTKSFLILVNGRIVMETYFKGHTQRSTWGWNSASKTLIAITTGIAQEEKLLDINNKASVYLGAEWTSMPLPKENLITVRHLLTMTSGTDDTKEYVVKPNLTYVADAGNRWAYSNIFKKLTDVIANASKKSFEKYFNEKINNKIGMDGAWDFGTVYANYQSTTRSMSRFGLLALNKGKWNKEKIVSESFFNESISTSQSINPSYGYLWWLNGKKSFMIPDNQAVYQGFLVPNAPADMYGAMGANDQRIFVIPSKNMVVIRMGDANSDFAGAGFDFALWEKINAVIK
jgi:CubicO group peptidase (beta-lactamase class C family)